MFPLLLNASQAYYRTVTRVVLKLDSGKKVDIEKANRTVTRVVLKQEARKIYDKYVFNRTVTRVVLKHVLILLKRSRL